MFKKVIMFIIFRVVRLEVSILRVTGSYPTQWTSMYVLVKSQSLWDRVVG
jgi:hypothetical protein